MPYTVRTPDMTAGAQMISQGMNSAANSISGMFQMMGKMYLQDNQGGAIINALKQAGYGQDQPGKPGSAMIPAALFSAAEKGPLGTKAALSQVMMNYLNMNYQMKLAAQKYGFENGGFVGQQGGQGGQSSPQQAPAKQGGAEGFDLNSAPSPAGPWNPGSTTEEPTE